MESRRLESRIAELEQKVARLSAPSGRPLFFRLLSRTNILLGTLFCSLVIGSVIYAVTVPHSFSDGTVISASQMNANFTALATAITTLEGQVNSRIAYVKDVKSAGTAAQAASSTWATRELNTLEGGTGFVTLDSNVFTLAAGTYDILASAPFKNANTESKLKLVEDPSGTPSDAIIGQSTHADGGTREGGATAVLMGTITISSSSDFEIQQRSTQANTNGFGSASNFGVSEVYTQVRIEKLK